MFITDKGFNKFEQYIDEQTGFLKVNGVLARTGVQDYLAIELGDSESDPSKVIGVYRPREEVLNQESLDSYINAPVTDNHPDEFVNINNAKELIKGSVSSIETFSKDGIDYIKAKMTITDKQLINKIQNGKVEISAGYSQDLVKEKGEFNGKAYDYKQTNIRINHIAIVDKGRCGDKCKITADNFAIINEEPKNMKGSAMVKLKIGDAEVEVCDTVFNHINSLKDSIKKLKDEKEELKKDMEKLEGENEKLKEDIEEEKKKSTDSAIDALVSEKVALIDTAKSLNVDVKATDSIMDMKKSIIAANSKISLDRKSNEFIDGVYETVIAQTVGKQKAIKDSQSKAFDGFEAKPRTMRFADMAKEEL